MNYLDFEEGMEDYIVVVNSPAGTISGYMTEGSKVTLTTSSDWSPGSFTGAVDKGIQGVKNYVTKLVTGEGLKTTSIGQTIKTYSSSAVGGFSVSFMCIPGKLSCGSYTDEINKLSKLTLPKSNKGTMESNLYTTSLTKQIFKGNDVFKGGLIHVSIGSYFHASGLYCTSTSYEMSEIIDDEGKPLYMNVSLSFSPYRVLTADELSSWILK